MFFSNKDFNFPTFFRPFPTFEQWSESWKVFIHKGFKGKFPTFPTFYKNIINIKILLIVKDFWYNVGKVGK